MKLSSLALVLALLPAALFAAGGNNGGTTTTTSPTVIPGGTFASSYVITAPGSCVLGGNRSAESSTFVILIGAPDVTLDLNGFKLSSAPGTQSGGIDVPIAENVEIRNGSIVGQGHYGIRIYPGKGVRIVDVRIVGAKYTGLQSLATAMQVDRCHITDCVERGIWTNGAATLVTDCIVSGIGTSSGIILYNGSRVVRTVVRGGGNGIALNASTAVDCNVTGTATGFTMSDSSTVRASESFKNVTGVFTNQTANVIMGSRITSNTNTFGGGVYTNGGGNVIQ